MKFKKYKALGIYLGIYIWDVYAMYATQRSDMHGDGVPRKKATQHSRAYVRCAAGRIRTSRWDCSEWPRRVPCVKFVVKFTISLVKLVTSDRSGIRGPRVGKDNRFFFRVLDICPIKCMHLCYFKICFTGEMKIEIEKFLDHFLR